MPTAIKNLAYTIPTSGRISIGDVADNPNGRGVIPVKLNHFAITAQHKHYGEWVDHPAEAAVCAETAQKKGAITRIPVKVMVDDPDLIVRSRYESWDETSRIVCVGDGATAREVVRGEITDTMCVGPDFCQKAAANRCKMMTRLNVQVDVSESHAKDANYTPDPLGTFIARSSGVNTARTLMTKLKLLAAHTGGRLAGVPLDLVLRQKSSRASFDSTFYYLDIVPRQSLADTREIARNRTDEDAACIKALEDVIREGLANGPFEDMAGDFEEVAEFFATSRSVSMTGFDAGLQPVEHHNVTSSFDEEDGLVQAADVPAVGGLEALRQVIERSQSADVSENVAVPAPTPAAIPVAVAVAAIPSTPSLNGAAQFSVLRTLIQGVPADTRSGATLN